MISEMARRAPAASPGLRNSVIATCFSAPGKPIRHRDLLRLDRQVGDPQAIVEERIALRHRNAAAYVVLHRVADCHQPLGQPVAQAVAVEQRHHHVDVGLELDQPFARIGDRPFANAVELHAVVLLERPRQRDEIIGVHLQPVGMALIADDLIAMSRESCRPPRAANSPWWFGR